MKKFLACILTAILALTCLMACENYSGEFAWEIFRDKGNQQSIHGVDCYTVYTLEDFCGTTSMQLVREKEGEGALFYRANLTSGELAVSYRQDLLSGTQQLFTARAGELSENSGIYIEGKTFKFTFKADAPVSGEVIISFVPIEEHEHTGEWQASESTHYYQYTCGCPSPDIAELHTDCDENYICDICSYQMVAEGNHFIRNQAGAEWLCEITADDIAEIKITSGGGGPLSPVSFTCISSSRNKAVISSIFEEYYWLDSSPVPEEKTQIAGGGYVVVHFILNNGAVKKLNFINGDFYHDGNGNYFDIVRLPVFRDGTNFVNHYGFEIWEKYCQVHLIDETFVCEVPVSELEFTKLTDDIYLGDTAPTRYIEMNGEKLYFIRDSYFYIGNDRSVYYNLVGKNLDELIAEYSTIKDNGKVQTTIGEEAQLPQFMSLEADKHNALSNGSAINVDVYMGYDILNKDGVAFSDIIVPESDFAKYTFVLEINYNNEERVIALDYLNYFEEYRCDIYQDVIQYSKYNTVQLDTDKMVAKSYGFVNIELYMISDTNERYYVSAETLYYSVTDTEIVFGLVSNPVANEGDPGVITKGLEYNN